MKLKLDPQKRKTARALQGKTIARVILNPFDPNREDGHCIEEMATDPWIVFTDGTRLSFRVQETEFGEYGVDLLLYEK
jgi:hypothetical protein